eukprot:TRINITY_DN1190_c0_g1_i2.p1 TRINITY_DN1190_c0_g1~~TRINITY_DN1190_c0_g1_i2.p1  ORF type:complete len:533 (+),score=81.46 TRINITY_DN1190_c0_g1_i2:55-1653(+)
MDSEVLLAITSYLQREGGSAGLASLLRVFRVTLPELRSHFDIVCVPAPGAAVRNEVRIRHGNAVNDVKTEVVSTTRSPGSTVADNTSDLIGTTSPYSKCTIRRAPWKDRSRVLEPAATHAAKAWPKLAFAPRLVPPPVPFATFSARMQVPPRPPPVSKTQAPPLPPPPPPPPVASQLGCGGVDGRLPDIELKNAASACIEKLPPSPMTPSASTALVPVLPPPAPELQAHDPAPMSPPAVAEREDDDSDVLATELFPPSLGDASAVLDVAAPTKDEALASSSSSAESSRTDGAVVDAALERVLAPATLIFTADGPRQVDTPGLLGSKRKTEPSPEVATSHLGSWVKISESCYLPADAPAGHEAHTMITYHATHRAPFAAFTHQGIRLQVTLAASGSEAACRQIARACAVRLVAGQSKEQLLVFRRACYQYAKGKFLEQLLHRDDADDDVPLDELSSAHMWRSSAEQILRGVGGVMSWEQLQHEMLRRSTRPACQDDADCALASLPDAWLSMEDDLVRLPMATPKKRARRVNPP